MTPADIIIADALISQQLDLLRLGSYTQMQAIQLLTELEEQLSRLVLAPGLTEFTKMRLNTLLGEAKEIINAYYAKISGEVHTTLEGMAQLHATQTARAITAPFGIALRPTLPPATFLRTLLSRTLIHGAPSAMWWAKQSLDTQRRFAQELRAGVTAAETNAQIVARIVGTPQRPGVLATSKRNARALVHSSIQQVANEARLATFQSMSDVVKGVRQLSTLDSHTTEVCIAYSGKEWDLKGKPIGRTKLPFNGGPPRHWNCRSVLVPITKSFRELGLNINEVGYNLPKYASADGMTDLTMKQWLDARTPEQLADQLGKGKAAMYRAGKLSISQLVDMRGNPLTLREMQRRAAS